MSTGYSVLLIVESFDVPTVAQANKWLDDNNWPQLQRIDERIEGSHGVPNAWFAMGVKNFDEHKFFEVLCAIPWQDPDYVVMLVQSESALFPQMFRLSSIPQYENDAVVTGHPTTPGDG